MWLVELPPHHNRFTSLFPGPPGWAVARRELLDFMVQGKINRGRHTSTRHRASTSTCWHFTFTQCCHSNETCAAIANPPYSAQLGGTPCHSSQLHPGPCSSVGMWWGTVRHTMYILPRLRLSQNVINLVAWLLKQLCVCAMSTGKMRRSAEGSVRHWVWFEWHARRAGVALSGAVDSDRDLDE